MSRRRQGGAHEMRDRLARLSHLTMPQAAAATGLHRSSVLYYRNAYGLSFASAADARARAQKTYSARTRARYAALTHLPPSAVAVRLGVTLKNVQAAGRRYGLSFAPEPPTKIAPVRKTSDATASPVRVRAPRGAQAGAPPDMPMATAPDWSADRDALIVKSKGRLSALSALAARWGIPSARVTARWHVLRVCDPALKEVGQ